MPHGAETFLEAQTANTQIHKKIGDLLKKKSTTFNGGKSDEGAWIANIDTVMPLKLWLKPAKKSATNWILNVALALMWLLPRFGSQKKKNTFTRTEGKKRDTAEQLEFMLELIEKYHLAYVEDPFHEEDFDSFAELTRKAKNCLICGDDLFTTNTERLNNGIKINAGNAIIIKVNQIGTLTDATETIETAQRHGYDAVVSHRSGDTCDWHIAHLAVAYKCPLIKTGVVEGARIAKLNELIRIEHFLGNRAKMADLKIR